MAQRRSQRQIEYQPYKRLLSWRIKTARARKIDNSLGTKRVVHLSQHPCPPIQRKDILNRNVGRRPIHRRLVEPLLRAIQVADEPRNNHLCE